MKLSNEQFTEIVNRGQNDGAIFFGDWHGKLSYALEALERVYYKYPEIDTYYHVGDFGLWPGDKYYTRSVADSLKDAGKTLVVTGGNHEDWTQWLEKTGTDSPYAMHGGDNLILLPKVYSWTQGTKNYLSVGGASSIDQDRRIWGSSWWPEEEITEFDVEAVEAAARRGDFSSIDVLITHESSDDPVFPVVTILNNHLGQLQWSQKARDLSTIQRKYVSRVVNAVAPKLHVHGHWHIPWIRVRPELMTVSLGADFASYAENAYVLGKENFHDQQTD